MVPVDVTDDVWLEVAVVIGGEVAVVVLVLVGDDVPVLDGVVDGVVVRVEVLVLVGDATGKERNFGFFKHLFISQVPYTGYRAS